MQHTDIVVIGAGQSGLAAAYQAKQAGRRAVVLEAGDDCAGSWAGYYDSLTLFSPARFSSLPGMPFPGDPERYPRRDEVVAYLRAYGDSLGADIRCGQRVVKVSVVEGGGFAVVTEAGLEVGAGRVIAASGGFGHPYTPNLPGLDTFSGPVLHSSEYRSPEAFIGKRVVVVGVGNSAVQIAAELAEVARVSLASRAPVRWMPQRPFGRDLHWWLTRSGIDSAPIGRWLGGRSMPVIDDGRYRAALASGNPDRRPLFRRLEVDAVVWADGAREDLDAVILATGYRPDLSYLGGIGALDESGMPLHRAGVSTTVPGLGYVGLEYQRNNASASLRGVGRDAAFVFKKLAG
ncbi:flavin-containing monooxygenase [Streptomyces agglomeratus]|uniref:flavin-containing monooxygenase n=1 Tax=Streptomyces agglomeratus TaxID=285458 RepID=UPI0008541B62|nr:NAD(P)/FAD-dependent oxidoreductase [Streptomyces agglomeratus]OEJ49622.1 FAD-dependent oxidoreductase [Streptomyces agglomeratus]